MRGTVAETVWKVAPVAWATWSHPWGPLGLGVLPHLRPGSGPTHPNVCRTPRDTHALRQGQHFLQESTTRHLSQGREKRGTEVVLVGPETPSCELQSPRPGPAQLSEPPGRHDHPPIWPSQGDAGMQSQLIAGMDVTPADTTIVSSHEDASVPHTDALGGAGSGTTPGSPPPQGGQGSARSTGPGVRDPAVTLRLPCATSRGQACRVAEGSGSGRRAVPDPCSPAALFHAGGWKVMPVWAAGMVPG